MWIALEPNLCNCEIKARLPLSSAAYTNGPITLSLKIAMTVYLCAANWDQQSCFKIQRTHSTKGKISSLRIDNVVPEFESLSLGGCANRARSKSNIF